MLSKENNELLTRVGKGTPMGEMMRRYWHPIALSSELPEPDCDPLRQQLLGEFFVVWRNTDGDVGVMDELCTHRGASMALARVEDGGIRCLYHGWKFSVDGTILDTPNSSDARIKQRLKGKAYPVREHMGLIWTYIGPKEHEPPFRHFAYETVPAPNRNVFKLVLKANYLQLWEAGTDSSHVGILHSNVTRPGWLSEGAVKPVVTDMIKDAWDDMSPKLEIENTSFGFHYVGIRKLDEKMSNVRLTPLFLPYGRIIEFPDFYTTVFDTPVNDYTTSSYLVNASPTKVQDMQERLTRAGLLDEAVYKDGHFMKTWEDRFGQDREAMRRKESWSGIEGITHEDAVVTTSMGSLYDRSTEHLVAADAAVVRLRHRLLESLQRFQAGESPIGVEVADLTHMHGFDHNLGADESWRRYAADHAAHYGVSEQTVQP